MIRSQENSTVVRGSSSVMLSMSTSAGLGASSSKLMGRSRTTKTKQPPSKFRVSAQAGKKVSKVRWLRTGQEGILPDPMAPEYFVLGSWGELENEVSLWKLSSTGVAKPPGEEGTSPDIQVVMSLPVLGNVSDIVAVTNNTFALTTSAGTVALYRLTDFDHNGRNPGSFQQVSSKALHHSSRFGKPCPATGITVSEMSIATVGEDGSIYEISLDTCDPIQSLEGVDVLSLCSVEFVVNRTIATGNSGGQVKLWDLRSGRTKPAQTLNHLDDLSSAITIAPHPTQSHILLVGYTSGATDLWDTRGNSSEPIANLHKQEGAVSEISFHPIYPDNFYTCSQSGEVIHWSTAETLSQSELVQNNDYQTDLNLEFLKYGLSFKLLYSSPFPVNSMNLSRNERLVCGGDSGMIFCTEK